MKLVFKRTQKDISKGVFRASTQLEYTIWVKLEFTPEEEQLVHRHNLGEMPMAQHGLIENTNEPFFYRVSLLMGKNGCYCRTFNLGEANRFEQEIKSACPALKAIIDEVRARPDVVEEVIEFPDYPSYASATTIR